MSSSGQQKRRRNTTTTTTTSSSSSSCDASSGIDCKDWNEADGEEERAITNNHTDTKRRRTELFEEDEDAIATGAAAEATATTAMTAAVASTNAIVRPRGSPSNKWNRTPVSLFIRTLSYLDNTTLMVLCLVCKQIRDIIWTGQGMETKLVRIFELSPSRNKNDDDGPSYVRRFVSNMNQYFQNVTKTRILQGFQHWKVQDVEEFDDGSYAYIDDDELERLTQNIRMTGIVSLDMSLLLPISVSSLLRLRSSNTLYRFIPCMVPNLQQLDLSHMPISCSILEKFAVQCPRLEIIRWNNNDVGSSAPDADRLKFMNNLRELYFDNRHFGFNHDRRIDENGDTVDDDDDDDDNSVTEIEAMADSHNYPNIFLFCRLWNKPLERISIRNAQYTDPNWLHKSIPQSVLMKFVRKAPTTLLWFRSDLSPANIQILQSERPGIQLLN